MKNVAIIKKQNGEVMETRNFKSYPEVERYVEMKYNNEIFDWTFKKGFVEKKPDEFDLEMGLETGSEIAKIHTIVIKGE